MQPVLPVLLNLYECMLPKRASMTTAFFDLEYVWILGWHGHTSFLADKENRTLLCSRQGILELLKRLFSET